MKLKKRLQEKAEPEITYKCKECFKTFSNSEELQKHSQQKVSAEKEIKERETTHAFSCISCNMSFSEFNALRRHKKGHSEKLFKCPHCDKESGNFGTLVTHKKLHGNEPETNVLEAQTESTVINWENHERTHTNEKPFECTHEGNHEENPHSCPECDKKFSNCNVISWNIDKLDQIIEVLKTEDIGICFLSEVDEKQRNLESIAPSGKLPNFTSHTVISKEKKSKQE